MTATVPPDAHLEKEQRLDTRRISTTSTYSLTRLHPLRCTWVLWYLKADRAKDWLSCLKVVAAFNTIEEFWTLYNNLNPPSGLDFGSDYYIFKEGIQPVWEDPSNLHGGRWLIPIDKQRRNHLLDHYWLEMIIAVLGGQLELNLKHVCGVVANVRAKGDKVALWTRDCSNTVVNTEIGTTVKNKLKIPDTEIMRYEAHRDTSIRTSSIVKPRILLPPVASTASS